MSDKLSAQELSQLGELIKDYDAKLKKALDLRYEAIREKVENMAFSKLLNIRCIELMQGFAHLEISTLPDTHSNWNNFVHGGVAATLIDTAIGAAIETLINFDKEPVATIHLSVDFTNPAQIGKTLCAKASWAEGVSQLNGNKVPIIEVPQGNKKLIQVSAKVISKPDRTEIATGSAWYVIFGSRKIK